MIEKNEIQFNIDDILNASTEISFIATDTEGIIQVFNKGAENLLGYNADELIGKKTPAEFHLMEEIISHGEVLSREYGHTVEGFDVFVKKAQQGLYDSKEWTYVHKNGRHISVELTVTAIRDSKNNIKGFLGVAKDFTERNIAITDSIESESKMKAILDNAVDAIININDIGMIESFNKAAEDMFGFKSSEIIGKSVNHIIPMPHSEMHDKYLADYRKKGGSCPVVDFGREGHGRRKDGSTFPIDLAVNKVQLPDRVIYTGILRDITLRKKHEAEIIEQKQELQDFLESASDIIQSVGPDGKFIYVNKEWMKRLGYSPSEIKEMTIFDIIHPDHKEQCSELFKKIMKGERIESIETVFITRNRESIIVEGNSNCRFENGKAVATRSIFRDITKQKEIDAMKNEFVSTVSHELRTPLTSIRGSLGLITGGVMGEVPEDIMELLVIAKNNTERLVNLINDILDLEKIESGRVTVEKKEVSLSEIVKRSIDEMEGFAKEKNINLCNKTEDYTVMGDSDKIIQVLDNYISNAIKFSQVNSRIVLKSYVIDDEVVVSVKDTGEGIPDKFKDRIFKKFQQADSSVTRKKGGTGLGLAICKSIVEAHGGRVWHESDEGEGSEFFLTLKLCSEDEENKVSKTFFSEDHDDIEKSRKKLILVIDDDPDIIKLLQIILEKEGYRSIPGFNGEMGLARAKKEKPDLIILDIKMPGLSGFDVLKRLKEDQETAGIPVVFLSAGEKNDFVDVEDLPVNEWLKKPVDEEQLISNINNLTKTDKKKKIIFIDDDPDIIYFFKNLFDNKGIEIFSAHNAHEGIKLLEKLTPDLIITDVNMPDGDGYCLIEFLRDKMDDLNVPVLVFSGKELDEEEKKRMSFKETEFLTKLLVSENRFVEIVSNMMEKDERR